MRTITIFFLTICLIISGNIIAQQIPSDKVVLSNELKNYLKKDIQAKLETNGELNDAVLAEYFRSKFSQRYFYDWQTFDSRLKDYNKLYKKQSSHRSRAADHMGKFADSTQWLLPFNYLNGDPVNAYALRHLARSHKMIDIAFQYFYDNKDPKYIKYFTAQMRSLNAALQASAYEKIEDGNGVYEVFRSGYRVLNWLRIHNMFLGEDAYTDTDQLTTIATMIQHGQDLYEQNDAFRSGNHQTRGMSALAMLAILLKDFEGTDQWYERAMTRLEEHLNREINEDGFQFERSVHYHISDIGNFFYVYQLAQIGNIEVSAAWEKKLESLFNTLTMIAYPDKSAPVLQDDTERPWAERNEIGSVMTLGYLLFENPEFGYFADKRIDDYMYWFVQGNQLAMLKKINKSSPKVKSYKFDKTGYFIMREGWNKRDNMMIISAGLDDKKPDHQHGDMLGVQAMANEQVILPNYQVRYSLPDYEFFKNSLVKNVALVDDEMQGKKYKGNKGGSGFGKFGELPNPRVLLWHSDSEKDIFVGSHDGFENITVSYSRQVIYVKNDFWIVKDNFNSPDKHIYKQVWQGHYTLQNSPNLLRSSFTNGTGLDIFQLNTVDLVKKDGTQGKEWSIISKENESNFSFITVLIPFSHFNRSLDETTAEPVLNGWILNKSPFTVEGDDVKSLTNGDDSFLFNISKLKFEDLEIEFSTITDLVVNLNEDEITIQSFSTEEVQLTISGKRKNSINETTIKKTSLFKPGDKLVSKKK